MNFNPKGKGVKMEKELLAPYVGKSLYIKLNDWYCMGANLLSVDDESFTIQFGNDTLLKLNYNEIVEFSPLEEAEIKHCKICNKVLFFNGELCFNCNSKKEKHIKKEKNKTVDTKERIKNLHIITGNMDAK